MPLILGGIVLILFLVVFLLGGIQELYYKVTGKDEDDYANELQLDTIFVWVFTPIIAIICIVVGLKHHNLFSNHIIDSDTVIDFYDGFRIAAILPFFNGVYGLAQIIDSRIFSGGPLLGVMNILVSLYLIFGTINGFNAVGIGHIWRGRIMLVSSMFLGSFWFTGGIHFGAMLGSIVAPAGFAIVVVGSAVQGLKNTLALVGIGNGGKSN